MGSFVGSAHRHGRKMKFRRTGRHTTPSQVEKVAEKAGKAAPAMAISAGVLMSVPHGHNAAPVKHDTVAAQSVTGKAGHAVTTRLDSVVRPAQQQDRSYTVRSGDTLSTIAQQFYGKSAEWAWLDHVNSSKVRNANLIYPGQVLSVPADPPANFTPAVTATPVTSTPSTSGSYGDSNESQQAAPAQAAPAQAAPAQTVASAASASSGAIPGGAFGACVVARESGGNAQVMNSSGHYGLYQFSASTWAAYGGNPAHFGNASAGEQNQVFANAIAQGGQSNWSPYDGC
jgi:LysM repeat protein